MNVAVICAQTYFFPLMKNIARGFGIPLTGPEALAADPARKLKVNFWVGSIRVTFSLLNALRSLSRRENRGR